MTQEICSHLIMRHRRRGWRAEKEALFSPRRIDVLAIAPGAAEVIGFEIKVSIADFRNELRTPEKRAAVARYCTQFYFVSPRGLVTERDVPEECGLIYFSQGYFYLIKPAPNKRSEMVFETDDREILERFERKQEEASRFMKEIGPQDGAPHDGLPRWMLPQFCRPLWFQFDIQFVAAGIATAVNPAFIYNFDEVPF